MTGGSSMRVFDDQRRILAGLYSLMTSTRYDGWVACSDFGTSVAILKLILARNGTQCIFKDWFDVASTACTCHHPC